MRSHHDRLRAFLKVLGVAAVFLAILAFDGLAAAQTAREVFEKVAPTVVVIRAQGRDVTAAGRTRFTETGSGVLISKDGHVMTAAHVVQTLDEIAVEFLGGETVRARVVASEPAADLSLLQLDRVPPGAVVAPMADSDTVRVGDPVIVVGAPYGLGHSLSAGLISARWPAGMVYAAMPLAEKASPADEIGLRSATMIVTIAGQEVPLGGDIVLSVQGIPFSRANAPGIRDALSRLPPGAPYIVTILRAGDVLELTGRAR